MQSFTEPDWPAQLAFHIRAQLDDDSNPLTKDLFRCGSDFLHRLRLACCNLESSCEILEDLITTAQDKLSSSISSNTLCWRRLFTDSCLLRVVTDVNVHTPIKETTALQCIARLDQAIIVAGPAGEGRLELLLDIIAKLQATYSHTVKAVLGRIPPSTSSTKFFHLSAASRHVMCLDTAPSISSFQTSLCQHPFILRGYASDWPALNERPWSSLDYLRSVAGPGRIVPVEVGRDYRYDDWSQTLMAWEDFLPYLKRSNQFPQAEVLYLAQHSLLTQFPALRRDIVIPDYVYTCPVSAPNFPDYKPPGNEEQLVINIWLGPGGTVSPAHTDPYFNIYVQVVGRKRVWLASPDFSSSMYPYPPSPSATSDKTHNPAANNVNPSMSNTSRVDVFGDAECHNDYPEFTEKVCPHAVSTILEPGDVLFFPPGWWHAMRSEETSLSVSMWF